jgi:predicted membrane protein (TIGR00267 family)
MDIHLHHQEHHLKSSDLLRDIVIGMSDGLTVPFALAAGLSGAVNNTNIIVVAGLAEIAAGSIAMGLGGYLAGKTEQDHYAAELKREYEEIETKRDIEIAEVKQVFAEWGLSENVQTTATNEIIKDKDKWVQFMMKHELHLDQPESKRATKSAFNIGFSYVIGGLVPLMPYFFVEDSMYGFKISVAITLCCLFIFGYFKSKITGVSPTIGGFKVMLIGAAAAGAAFIIAKLLGA